MSKYDKSIVVTGRVDDVRPYIASAAAYIVPIRIGGGTRLKIYEAMAMERPVVSTTIGAEGLPLRHEEELLLADTAETFAAAVVRLLKAGEFAQSLARRGAVSVRERFGWKQVTVRFAEICSRAASQAAGAGTQNYPEFPEPERAEVAQIHEN